jgi:hypothetical protein
MTAALPRHENYPTIYSSAIFRFKTTLLQINRGIRDFLKPAKSYPKTNDLAKHEAIATSATPLWNNFWLNESKSEQALQLGKIQNLIIAARTIHGVEIPKDGIFSFWTYVGQPTRWKGYVEGREIRQGCMIPSIGGGLCQLSNALYSVALDAGFEILERHAHTQIVPGSLAEIDRDATVFWNYVDLRFKVDQATRFEVMVTDDELIVEIKGTHSKRNCTQNPLNFEFTDQSRQDSLAIAKRSTIDRTHDCLSCEVSSCHRNISQSRQRAQTSYQRLHKSRKTAYLVDEYWIEFDHYIQSRRTDRDLLAIPLDGKAFKKDNYAWQQTGFGRVKTATFLTLTRALATRNLSPQGQSLQNTLLKHDQKLAEYFSSLIAPDISHVVVTQNLLPFLWQNGSLNGKTFDVLMTRLPLAELQKKLDFAYRLHPNSSTLNDFRLNSEFTRLEIQALAQARKLITPHTAIAAIFPERTHAIDWHLPITPSENKPENKRILFPAAALGRKGAYEIRAVAQKLNLELTVLGRELEGENFWEGLTIHKPNPNCLDEVGLVVLPAFVEHKPRILLRAIARQITVIASYECGLGNLAGVTEIPSGDVVALLNAVQKNLQGSHERKLTAKVVA